MNSLQQFPNLAALVLQVQSGDRQAFEQLFQQTHRLARKIAFSTVGPDLAEDVVQESYILVFRKLPQLEDPKAFLGWLSRLVLHTCYKMARKESPARELPEGELGAPDQTEALLNSLHLRQALKRLRKEDREILILRELLALSYEEVAYAMLLPVGTVRSRLHSARKKLAESLKL